MPQEIVDALMAQGASPEEAMAAAYPDGGAMPPEAAAGPAPMMGPGAPTEDDMIGQLLEGVMMKWAGDQAQMAGEKSALLETLMMIAAAGGAMPPQDMVEGMPMNAGIPAPMEAPMGGM